MKRIAIYQRGHVTEEEKSNMTEFIGSIPGAIVTGVFWDHDGSERSQFRAMIAAAREEQYDAIIAQSICRFARSSEECIRTVHDLHEHHTRVWFARERFWSTGFTAWLLWATDRLPSLPVRYSGKNRRCQWCEHAPHYCHISPVLKR